MLIPQKSCGKELQSVLSMDYEVCFPRGGSVGGLGDGMRGRRGVGGRYTRAQGEGGLCTSE